MGKKNTGFKTQEWKDIRLKEINAMGYKCDDSHPYFDEVMSIYESDAETYEEFKQKQKNLIKPSNSNKNWLTALNTTGGLTSANGSGSTTIIRQRQIVRVPVPVTV